MTKVQKALAVDGPAFINVLVPCRLGWAFQPQYGMQIARDAVNTLLLAAVRSRGRRVQDHLQAEEKMPVEEFLKKQTKFRHLFQPGNEAVIEELQARSTAAGRAPEARRRLEC